LFGRARTRMLHHLIDLCLTDDLKITPEFLKLESTERSHYCGQLAVAFAKLFAE
jgi:hypothetical protein